MIRGFLKNQLVPLLRLGQRFGVTIVPNHYYTEYPDDRALERTQHWRRPLPMKHVRGSDPKAQFESLTAWMSAAGDNLQDTDLYEASCARHGAIGYGPGEACVLYAFTRAMQPRRVIQIGAGVSTAVMQQAAADAKYEPTIVCVDPFPSAFLRAEAEASRIKLINQPAQEVGANTLAALDAGDLLFIDSTHTVRLGSEVPYLMFSVVPILPPGVHVHFHDIYFPYDFNSKVLKNAAFGRETAMLFALLIHNERLHIDVSLSMLHHADPARLEAIIPGYRPRAMNGGFAVDAEGMFASATYLRTEAPDR